MRAQIRCFAGSEVKRLLRCRGSRVRLVCISPHIFILSANDSRHAAGRRLNHSDAFKKQQSRQSLFWLASAGSASLVGSFFLVWHLVGTEGLPESWKLHADSSEQSLILFRGRRVDIGRDADSLRAPREELQTAIDRSQSPTDAKPKNAWNTVTASLTGWKAGFASLPDKITNLIVPDWVQVRR